MGSANTHFHHNVVDTSMDNQSLILLSDILNILIHALDVLLASHIQKLSAADPLILNTINVKAHGSSLLPHFHVDNFKFGNSALYYKGHLYVLKSTCQDIICTLHNFPVNGHDSYFCIIHLVQKDYWWPSLSTFAQCFVAGCTTCQANKVNIHFSVPSLCPISSIVTYLFQQISCDLIMDLPLSSGFYFVLIMVDHGLTKGVIFIPCNKSVNAKGIAILHIFKYIFSCFGLHNKVISDYDPQFTSNFIKELA